MLIAPAYTCMSVVFWFLQPLVSILSLIHVQNSYDVLKVLLGGEEIQCLVQTVPCECCIPIVICHLEKMQLNNIFRTVSDSRN